MHPRAPRASGRQAVTLAGSAAQCAPHRQTSTLSRMLAWQLERDPTPCLNRDHVFANGITNIQHAWCEIVDGT
jgi:hypothetical protein